MRPETSPCKSGLYPWHLKFHSDVQSSRRFAVVVLPRLMTSGATERDEISLKDQPKGLRSMGRPLKPIAHIQHAMRNFRSQNNRSWVAGGHTTAHYIDGDHPRQAAL
jgi:hypothetical protein